MATALVACCASPALAKTKYVTQALSPGQSYKFSLPVADAPVRLDISYIHANGGTPASPSEVATALVDYDSSSGVISWVSSNNDAGTGASNSTIGKVFCTFFPDGSTVGVGTRGLQLVIKQSASGSGVGNWSVTMWY
jgi:hypothetical protein